MSAEINYNVLSIRCLNSIAGNIIFKFDYGLFPSRYCRNGCIQSFVRHAVYKDRMLVVISVKVRVNYHIEAGLGSEDVADDVGAPVAFDRGVRNFESDFLAANGERCLDVADCGSG